MRTISSAVTSKGQVTIPREVRERLGLRESDRVTFVIEDSVIRLEPGRKSFAELAGSVPPLAERKTQDFEEIIDEAMQNEADRIVRGLGQS